MDDDFDRIGGQRDKLIGVLQEKYGYAREKAQQEVERRLKEYSDTMSGPSSSGRRDTAAAGAGGPDKAPHAGAIATTAAALTGGVEAAQGAMSTAATAVAEGWESAQGAMSTAATAVTGGMESAMSTAVTAVTEGVEAAQGALSTATTAVTEGAAAAKSYLQEKKIDELVTDLTALIRTYPIPSLLAGMGFGYMLARLTRR